MFGAHRFPGESYRAFVQQWEFSEGKLAARAAAMPRRMAGERAQKEPPPVPSRTLLRTRRSARAPVSRFLDPTALLEEEGGLAKSQENYDQAPMRVLKSVRQKDTS